MDTGKLILIIQQKECLWNRKNYYYYNRQVHQRTWKEVAKEAKYSVEAVQKKWKHVRDMFRREHKKATTYRPGEGDYIPKWPFYNSLLFIKGIKPPVEITSCAPSEADEGVDPIHESTTTTEDDSGTALEIQQPSTSRTGVKTPLKNNHKHSKKLSNFDSKLLQVEEEKLVKLNGNVVDSEMRFLMSLYPFLKQVPLSRQLKVRSNIMRALRSDGNTPQYSTIQVENIPCFPDICLT